MSDGTRLIAGAMSGTSGDGVDVAIVRVEGVGFSMKAQLLHHHHVPFDSGIRSELFSIRDSGELRLSDLAKLGRDISLTYARAVNESLAAMNLRADELSAVAAHGQTLYHDPPNTIQWFDPALVAEEAGCAVISDFRRADCAAGGQGAPLVPFADYILFRDPIISRAVVNIGGIANLTLLPAGALVEQIIAFDTGPGNCISDYLVRTHDPAGPGIDVDGSLAAAGKLNKVLMYWLAANQYFSAKGPKSTDGPAIIQAFREARHRIAEPISLQDELATACTLTATQIVSAITQTAPTPQEIILSGGGIKNKMILRELRQKLPGRVRFTDEFGVPSDAKEAIAFALLGAATLDNVPSNIPSVTGARRAVVLGSITPKP